MSVSYVLFCSKSVYPTTIFLRDHNGNKVPNFFVLSLPSHLTTITTIFNFNEFIFVYFISIRFICDGQIYLLAYFLACLLASLLACLFSCLLAWLLALLLAWLLLACLLPSFLCFFPPSLLSSLLSSFLPSLLTY